jgi:hypothetical protein
MTAYKQRRSGTLALGMLAAWTADQYRLGRKRAANRFLSAELRAGRLKGEAAWPRGQAFITLLKGRLKAWAYTGPAVNASASATYSFGIFRDTIFETPSLLIDTP